MTDDRARRIRDLRNRRSTATDDEEDSSDTADSESDSDDERRSPESDETAATDGNGDPADADDEDGATDQDTDSADDEDDDRASDGTPLEPEPQGVDEAQGETDAETTQTATNEEPSPAESDPSSQPSASTSGSGEELTYDESSVPAAAATEPELDVDETSPMVDPQQSSASAFGGAIADSSVVAEFVDDVGTESTVDASAAMADAEGYDASGGRGADVFEQGDGLIASAHDDDDTIQMLEFHLNDNRYAVEIDQISAIVEMKEITRFPRGPEPIDGVTDLRGEITAVLDPTVLLDVERNELTDDQYIVVLERDDDKQKLGVRVTDVSQAVTYRTSQIDETASVMDTSEEHEFINGIIKKSTDDRTELVTWLDTDQLIENTG